MSKGKWINKKPTDYEFRVLRHLRKHQDRWFTIAQLSNRLRIKYFTVAQMLRRFREQEKVIWRVHKKDFKGYPENIYKYQRDALDEIIVDDNAHKKTQAPKKGGG